MDAEDVAVNANQQIIKLCSFRLSGRLFGVDILDVKEVNSEIEITPIFHASKSIRGYMNIRGQIHLVVDLRTEFSFSRGEIGPESKVLIFKQNVDEPFGVLVDSIGDVVEVAQSEISDRRLDVDEEIDPKIAEQRKSNSELCNGVCALDKELMLVLNARGILEYNKNSIDNN